MSALESIERVALLLALRQCQGSQKDAARLLGISPRVMCFKVKAHGIQWRRFRYDVVGSTPPLTVHDLGQLDPEFRYTLNLFMERVLRLHRLKESENA